jgi:hypothetical protein
VTRGTTSPEGGLPAAALHAPNGTGTETELKFSDWTDVGVLDQEGKPLYLERVRVKPGDLEFTAVVDQRPAKAGVDPLNKLIDRKPDDNTVAVEKL